MDSLRIDTGVKTLMINDDPANTISFNPSDVVFAEKFYGLIRDLEKKQADFQARAAELEAAGVDADGVPVNMAGNLALTREICEYMRGQIDSIFGAGASQRLFGDALSLDAFEQFFSGISPFIQAARSEKTAKYLNP